MHSCRTSLAPIVIGACVVLSMATNLRVSVGPLAVGPGELALLGLASWGLASGRVLASIKNPILWFWGLLVVTMTLGYLTGSVEGEWALRNTVAYMFTFFVTLGVSCLLAGLSDEKLSRLILWVICLATLITWVGFVFFIVGTEETARLTGLTQLGQRYSGWSSNPNQLALFFLPLPILFLAVLFSNRGCFKPANPMLFAFFCLILLLGLLIRSDALLVAWLVGFLVWAMLQLAWAGRHSAYVVLSVCVVFMSVFAVFKTFVTGQTQDDVKCVISKVIKYERYIKWCEIRGGQFGANSLSVGLEEPELKKAIRLDLWSNGLSAWVKAPVFGHGPGAYAYYSNVEHQNALESSGRSFEEAHNTPIDLLTQGGVLLALGWFGLLIWLVYKAWMIRDSYTLTIVLMIGVFSLFHYHVRQPYLWFLLLVTYEAIRRRLFVAKFLVE